MRRLTTGVAAPALMLLALATGMYAQRAGGDWMTSGFDAQRSSWVRNDGKISPESMQKPGFALDWKVKLNNQARGLNSVTPPSLMDFYIGYRGFRALGFFGGSSNKVIALDTDIARLEWEKEFNTAPLPPAAAACPGGVTAAVTRPTYTAYPAPPSGRGAGRGTPAKSGVGEPFAGAVTIRPQQPQAPRPPVPAAKPKPAAPAAPSPFAPRVQYAVALTGDGMLRRLWVSNGHAEDAALPFVPANADARGLIVYDGTAYVSTTGDCPGVDGGVWALDLATGQVSTWKSGSKGIVGTAGQAAGPDGTVYAASGGGELVALAPKTLKQLAAYKAPGVEFTSSPVVFAYKGKDLIAVTSSDGKLHLLDTASLSTPLAVSSAFSGANFAPGALASWQDQAGTRWILVPSGPGDGAARNGSIVAWKIVERNGALALQKGWVSRDLVSPLTPIVVNGVIFALSSGRFPSDNLQTTLKRSTPAVLYALDALTGKEIWNSGKTITSFVHSGGLAAGGGRIYVSGYDGTQYAFSFPIEH